MSNTKTKAVATRKAANEKAVESLRIKKTEADKVKGGLMGPEEDPW